MALLEYPVTRPIPLNRIASIAFIVGALLFIGLVTLINVVAVGYELIPITSTEFNSSGKLWYDHLLPVSWRPTILTCQPALINLNEG